MKAFIGKKEIQNKTVGECLTLIHNNEVHESAINHVSRQKLSEFVMELFDKGILNNYLNLK